MGTTQQTAYTSQNKVRFEVRHSFDDPGFKPLFRDFSRPWAVLMVCPSGQRSVLSRHAERAQAARKARREAQQ